MSQFNYQESAYRYARQILFDACGESVKITRAGVQILSAQAILAQTKYEDADPAEGQAFANFVDVLIFGSNNYTPKTGDIVTVSDTGCTFVARPVASNLWKYDDPYNLVLRFHAQRRDVVTSGGAE